MATSQTGTLTGEKSGFKEDENIERNDHAIDRDRDTFLPRPSDDPNDPLNWALSLKVSIERSHIKDKDFSR